MKCVYIDFLWVLWVDLTFKAHRTPDLSHNGCYTTPGPPVSFPCFISIRSINSGLSEGTDFTKGLRVTRVMGEITAQYHTENHLNY